MKPVASGTPTTCASMMMRFVNWCATFIRFPRVRSMPAEAVVEALQRVWSILDELHVPAAVMGGLSLAAWNRVRSTHDVDILIGLTGIRPQALLSRLYAEGFRAKGPQAINR